MKNPYAGPMAGATLAAILAGCAPSNVATNPVVPDNLKAPAGQTLSLVSPATGVQIYECSAGKTDPAKFEWAFKAPEADLFDLSGGKIGKHFAGPTWESNDGSKVVGEVKARDDGPDANAIPWLLLSAKTTSGTGVFGQTKSIQRLHTAGGKAPAETCDPAQLGKQARVAYRATYYFYIASP
jgi:Protein of unknown function (DUF3455)